MKTSLCQLVTNFKVGTDLPEKHFSSDASISLIRSYSFSGKIRHTERAYNPLPRQYFRMSFWFWKPGFFYTSPAFSKVVYFWNSWLPAKNVVLKLLGNVHCVAMTERPLKKCDSMTSVCCTFVYSPWWWLKHVERKPYIPYFRWYLSTPP